MRLEIGLVASRSESNRKEKSSRAAKISQTHKGSLQRDQNAQRCIVFGGEQKTRGGFELRNDLHHTK